VAAVFSYLARQAAAGAGRPASSAAGRVSGAAITAQSGRPSPWALYGRQALMNQRVRLQARRRK
jgi:hypothetical protein